MGILIYFEQRTENREQKRKEKNIDWKAIRETNITTKRICDY
jgi:hypothetical protein